MHTGVRLIEVVGGCGGVGEVPPRGQDWISASVLQICYTVVITPGTCVLGDPDK